MQAGAGGPRGTAEDFGDFSRGELLPSPKSKDLGVGIGHVSEGLSDYLLRVESGSDRRRWVAATRIGQWLSRCQT